MSICHIEYNWVTCDHPGCKNESRSEEDCSEELAIEMAMEDEFERSPDGRWFCPEHSEFPENAP